MKRVFVDTAGWMACADESDPAHKPACAVRDTALEQRSVLVTTDYVIDETLTLIRRRLGLTAAKAWWEQVEGSSRLRWEWTGPGRSGSQSLLSLSRQRLLVHPLHELRRDAGVEAQASPDD